MAAPARSALPNAACSAVRISDSGKPMPLICSTDASNSGPANGLEGAAGAGAGAGAGTVGAGVAGAATAGAGGAATGAGAAAAGAGAGAATLAFETMHTRNVPSLTPLSSSDDSSCSRRKESPSEPVNNSV